MYKFANNLLPANFDNYFTTVLGQHNHNTRASTKNLYIQPSVATTKYGILSIKYQTIKNWNNLQCNMRKSMSDLSLPQLKAAIKKHYLNSY